MPQLSIKVVGVSLDHSVSLDHGVSAISNIFLTKSHTEAIMCIPQIITYVVKEKGMKHKGNKVKLY